MTTKNNSCEDCRWWSEMIANNIAGTTEIEAMCLNIDSPHYQRMTHRGCEQCEAGRPVDCPAFRSGAG